VFTAALGLACLLPATAHAQAEVSPDFYPLSNTETIAPQPAQVASAKQTKADFEVPTNRAASQSALLVRKSDEGRRLEAVYVAIAVDGNSRPVRRPITDDAVLRATQFGW